MLRLVFAGAILLFVVFAVSSVNSATPAQETNHPPEASVEQGPAPDFECVIDLDCGEPGKKYVCEGDHIVSVSIKPTCDGSGSFDAKCTTSYETEILDVCEPEMMCVPGKSTCQTRTSCHDGIKDMKETGVDCGGPCTPCPSCSDKTKNGAEEGVDCGGPCKACDIQCTSDLGCGMPHWEPPYCGEDGSVYQDYMVFTCTEPGTHEARCERQVSMRKKDYCGPLNSCVAGRCRDDDDRDPYAYLDGGYFGSNRTRFVNEYKCLEGNPCYTKDEAYRTCRGSLCYDVRVPNSGEDVGHHSL
jgi:hypothetical protein